MNSLFERENEEKCLAEMKTNQDPDTLLATNSLENLGKTALSSNSLSYSSLNETLSNSLCDTSNDSITAEMECSISNQRTSDLTASDLENSFDSSRDTLSDKQDTCEFNCSRNDLEQVNIVECLLDLDDYLEKMEESCSAVENNTPTNKTSPSPFERCSKLRKTTAGHTQKTGPEHKTPYVQRTWNNRTAKKLYHRDENNMATNAESGFEERLCTENICGQVLTNDQIFQNLLEQQPDIECDRPRQYGRRAERYSSFASHLRETTPTFTSIFYENLRPANVTVSDNPESGSGNHDNMLYTDSEGSTRRSSRNTTPVSIESSTDSGEALPISEVTNTEHNTVPPENNNPIVQPIDNEAVLPSLKYGFNSYWPCDYSRTFALVSCTLGLFNTCRFANLTITYGGNFLIQFCILSVVFGIPFFWLQMSLGAKIESGPISMWKISPICIGVGISITLVQYFITIYSTIAVVWLLKFIQDICLYKSSYAWSESLHSAGDRQSSNISFNLTESIPYYFNINILQRTKLLKLNVDNGNFGINDRMAFYLAFVWAAVFLILCKGLKSFGKFTILLGVLPIVFLAATAAKLLCVVDIVKLQDVFSSSEFDDFLVSSKSWAAAAQETFFTWGIFGASVIAISSRTNRNSSKFALRKDAILVVLFTILGLGLSAIIGVCSIQILNDRHYAYVPGSYETPETYAAIFALKSLNGVNPLSYPMKFAPHYSTVVGEVFRHHTDTTNISGYQVLRFITEILPATLSVSVGEISWIWSLILFIAFFLFGLSQLCVLWKPISCALGNSTSAVLLSCVTGLLLGIPFITEIGISLLHYMDLLLGGAWFIPVLWSAEIFGIFLIRGRPYNGDDLVNDLKMSGSMSAFLALSWNILLPIGLITLAIIEYKISQSNQFYYWRGKSYFNYWSRKAAVLVQIGFLILVPISAIIQMYRYLTSGPPDILDRIQMLYRPLSESEMSQATSRSNRNMRSSSDENRDNSPVERFQNDAPPKYTPPPSYSTATGAKLAKILRRSIRRSVRRILGESEPLRTVLSTPNESHCERLPSPSANVLVETREETAIDNSQSIEFDSRPSLDSFYRRSASLGRNQILNKRRLKETIMHPLSLRANYNSSYRRKSSHKFHNRPFTAEDVKSILRSSTLGRRRIAHSAHFHSESNFRSNENLVQNAELPNLSSTIVDGHDNMNSEYFSSEI